MASPRRETSIARAFGAPQVDDGPREAPMGAGVRRPSRCLPGLARHTASMALPYSVAIQRCHTALPYSVATQAVWQRHEKEDGDEAENGYPPTQPEIFAIMIAKI